MGLAKIEYVDRDFLLAAREQDEVELLRQQIAEMQMEISEKEIELRAVQDSLAGTMPAA